MKLTAKDLREPKLLQLEGNEAWLSEIYGSFEGNDQPLKGDRRVSPEPYGVFSVKGHVDYTPFVECSRCQELVAFPIHRDIDVRFLDRDAAESGFDIEGEEGDEEIERELDSKDLDTYYVESSGELDIEMVINDFVQTSLPNRVTCSLVNKTCGIALQNEESGLVHKDKADIEVSPFAALKNLKLPKD